MKNTSVCSICEEGNLHAHVDTNVVEYKNRKQESPLHYSECDCCGSEVATPAQLRTNKRLMTEFKKQVDGLLTGKQLKELRLSLQLTQADAAEIFGGGPVAFAKYEADDVAQSGAMDKLLRLAQAVPEAFAYLTHNENRHVKEAIAVKSSQSDWSRLADAKVNIPNPLKKTSPFRLLASNDICEGEAYGQLRAVG